MKKIDRRASILLFVLFLVSIAVTMWTVVFNNSWVYHNNIEYQNIRKILNDNISIKSTSSLNLSKYYNSNWSWFIDNISCPTDITMSWSSSMQTGINSSIRYLTWNILCQWTYSVSGKDFEIYFNSWFTDFSTWTYQWSNVPIIWWIGQTRFSDGDSTLMTFVNTWLPWDNYDDDFNSDNYNVNSTWSIYYPDNYEDDDDFIRKNIIGYIKPLNNFFNVFWNNYKTNEYIDNNLNNSWSTNLKIWDVSDWIVFLDINWEFDMNIVKFNKSLFENDNIISSLDIQYGTNLSWSWYIQNNAWVLSLSWAVTWNEYTFDFASQDYGIFIKNLTWAVLEYNINSITTSWTWIYINPIDDSWTWTIKMLVNDIIINDGTRYSFENKEVEMEK